MQWRVHCLDSSPISSSLQLDFYLSMFSESEDLLFEGLPSIPTVIALPDEQPSILSLDDIFNFELVAFKV